MSIRSIVYWVLGHCVLDATPRATAECIASMHNIHSPDYAFTVLASISFSERHPSAINMFTLVYTVRVMEFSASITRTCALQNIRTTYMRAYNKHMPPALCLGTPVQDKKH